MSIQITIIGLGQIGASIGLALSGREDTLQRIGHDKNMAAAKAAHQNGAVDQVKRNLPNSVREADIIILSLPVNEIRETLEIIAPDLKEDSVVIDTAPIKNAISEWMKELLPPGRAYVGLVPVINPDYLYETRIGGEAARADLFHDGLMMIVSPPGTPGDAIRLAADLTRLLGAEALFADLAEADGLMTTTHLLPQLTAAALLNATVDQPGWHEGRKLAGRAYAEATAPIVHQDEIAALSDAALLNSENITRVLDGIISSLQGLRNSIAAEDKEALDERLSFAQDGRLRWWHERKAGDWLMKEDRKLETSGLVQRLLGFSRKPADK